jgi:hypothetical protein
MNAATPPPAATGRLAKTPFTHLVLYLYQRRSSGTLIVRPVANGDAAEEVTVLFHRGRAVAARLSTGVSQALDQALMPLTSWTDGSFEFHDDDLVGSGPAVVTGMFDPFAFVVEAARRYVNPEVADEVLARYAGVPLALQPSIDLGRLSLSHTEGTFVQALAEGPLSLESLLDQTSLPLPAARRLMYVLLITKIVGPSSKASSSQPVARNSGSSGEVKRRGSRAAGEGRSSDSGPFRASEPGRPSGPEVASGGSSNKGSGSRDTPSRPVAERGRDSGNAWRAIASRAAEMASMRPASSPRPPSPAPSSGRAQGSQPSARQVSRPVTPAPKRQSEPTSVSRPLSRPTSDPLDPAPPSAAGRPDSRPLTPSPFRNSAPGSQPRFTPSAPLNRVTPKPSPTPLETLDTAGKLRRVDQLCQRHAYDEALPIMRVLVEEDRKSAKYLGLLAHVLLGRSTDGNIGKEIVETVNLALRLNPDEINALYTKARCYKRMDKEREALHYFKRTIAVDPNHLEATREVRLLVLRMSEKRKR